MSLYRRISNYLTLRHIDKDTLAAPLDLCLSNIQVNEFFTVSLLLLYPEKVSKQIHQVSQERLVKTIIRKIIRVNFRELEKLSK